MAPACQESMIPGKGLCELGRRACSASWIMVMEYGAELQAEGKGGTAWGAGHGLLRFMGCGLGGSAVRVGAKRVSYGGTGGLTVQTFKGPHELAGCKLRSGVSARKRF